VSQPRLLDLFCGAGGAAVGYYEAGFLVTGVDIKPQPNYPGHFRFVQGDALDALDWALSFADFDAIHASPPCQAFTAYRRTGNVGNYPDLIDETRRLLAATGLPYVIENVAGAPLENAVMLCGSAFGLDVQRHRYFESNVPIMSPGCAHGRQGRDRFPGGRSKQRTGSSRGLVRATVEIGSWDIPLSVQQRAMGIDWMALEELSEAIPPAYTEHVGEYLMAEIAMRAAA
jgi:DNA (cytosine-5)-methyltransferase 1